MNNAINWFEIPSNDFERAKNFYAKILKQDFDVTEMEGVKMAMFNVPETGVGGAICCGGDYAPSSKGTVPYLNAGNDLSVVLNRVGDAGGEVVIPKTQIAPEMGNYAIFIDSEGNKIGLHSMN